MNRAYVLRHQEPYEGETKIIGVYSTEAEANAAIERLKDKPGFRDYPEWFKIEAYDLDADHWESGFIPPKRREIPVWGCMGFVFLVGALTYVAISGRWIALPFIIAYGLFFFGVAALAKRRAEKTDFSMR